MLWLPRPSAMGDMKASVSRFWCRKGFTAATVFGRIYTRTQEAADHLNNRFDALKNHEMIHLRQAQATGDSWLRFYLRYGWYWLRGLWWNRRMKNAAYWLTSVELEAYCHDNDLSYSDRCSNGAKEWRKYAKMNFEERKKVYEERFGA